MSKELDKAEQKRRGRRQFIGAGAGLAGLLTATTSANAGWRWICLDPKPCFLKGTMILTDKGEVAIEDLKAGDLVRTVTGAHKPIRWIGATTLNRDGRETWASMDAPIKIAKGALGDNAPHADLYVSPDHALYLDGVLVPAKYLVNGASITSETGFTLEQITYIHLELDTHEAIYAEGAAAETFREWGNRDRFDNAETYTGSRVEVAAMAPFAPLLALSRTQQVVVNIKSAVLPNQSHRGQIDVISAKLANRALSLTGQQENRAA